MSTQFDGATLRRRRRELGLTQGELAALLRVELNTIARWERGERPITAPGAVELALWAIERQSRAEEQPAA
jgi:transcriptional regulator with XRE-family HTH domain